METMTQAPFARIVIRSFIPRRVRNWLRTPANSVKWIWDEIKFLFGITQKLQIREGWFLTCHPAAYRCAYHFQVDDPEQVAEFNGFIRNSSEGMILFDIGAHFGLFSLAALHYGGPQARAIAVDPSAVAVRFLKIQAGLNNSSDRLRIVEASVAAATGQQDMVAVGVLASGFYVAPSPEHSGGEVIRTNSITLDSLADEVNLLPTHIKIDVEGSEAAVLRGAERLLTRQPAPTLFLELHNEMVSRGGGNPSDALTLLRNFGYETFSVDGNAIDDEAILEKSLIRIVAKKMIPIPGAQIACADFVLAD